ncbi:hypothetical protein EYZ83_07750 [Shigella flexneri]|nr:hypothetical protein [Escherichia coli]EFV9430997.1 hypothetical protein [Shigella flexneri]EFV9577609.1 hypothetical protein [Shigella sonnei]EFW9204309.1 hypothetical protein [Shigella boydii]QJZ64536.1 hypothetical protein E3171_26570 [Escherichia coli O55:H7]
MSDAFALLSCPTPETGKSKFSPLPAFPITEVSCRAGTEVLGISGADTWHVKNSRSRPGPASWLIRHFQLFSHFIIKITLNGRNQT